MSNKICVIGVGLIGGSIALAARKKGICSEIVGFGRLEDEINLDLAQTKGIVDRYYFDIESAVQDADYVVIATPVGEIEDIFIQLKDYWSDSAVYSDVGSTKVNVIKAAKKVFGVVPENFVPTHPIAGAEQSGAQAAIDNLFDKKRLIITPTSETSQQSVILMQQFWEKLGALVSVMDTEHHDHVLAATSHLPHILAFSLVDLLGKKDEKNEIFKFAAGGFKDFTRIASSDPSMWRDICLANKNEITQLIRQLQDELEKVAKMLENNESQMLFDTFDNARKARQRFLNLFEQ